jgi:hypothetical protein
MYNTDEWVRVSEVMAQTSFSPENKLKARTVQKWVLMSNLIKSPITCKILAQNLYLWAHPVARNCMFAGALYMQEGSRLIYLDNVASYWSPLTITTWEIEVDLVS